MDVEIIYLGLWILLAFFLIVRDHKIKMDSILLLLLTVVYLYLSYYMFIETDLFAFAPFLMISIAISGYGVMKIIAGAIK